MANPFGSGTRPWTRITEALRITSTTVRSKGELVVTDAGAAYVPDGVTQDSALSPLQTQALSFGLQAGDIRLYGGVAGTDCTAAFTAARAAGSTIYIPPGYWTYNGTGLDWANVRLTGAGRGNSHILLGAGKYLFSSTTTCTKFLVADVSIEGGAGAMRLTSTATNVGSLGMLSWERVDFYNYTAVNISHQFTDCPNWVFKDCVFTGANETASIGVWLNGDSANSRFDHCVFSTNWIGAVLGGANGGADVTFDTTDFIFGNPYSGVSRTSVWITPSTSTTLSGAPHFRNVKFGPENRSVNDYAVLIADSSASDPANAAPVLSSASTAAIRGLQFNECYFSGIQAAPMIYSTSPTVQLTTIRGLVLSGGLASCLMQFSPAALPNVAASVGVQTGTIDGLLNKDVGSTTVVPLTNSTYPVLTVVNDPRRTVSSGVGGTGDRLGFIALATSATASTDYILTPASIGFGSGNSGTIVADGLGNSTGLAITGGSSNLYAYAGLTGYTAGLKTWVELDLAAPTSGTAPTSVTVSIKGNGTDWQATLPIPVSWAKYRFDYTARDSSTTPQFIVQSSTPNVAVRIARVRVYHSPEAYVSFPVSSGASGNVQAFSSSGTWTAPAGVTVAHVIVVGAGGGGGGGCLSASGTAASGGGGGGGGGISRSSIPISALPSTVSVTVGAGGTAGASASTAGSGGAGGNGGYSSFGSYLRGNGGNGGNGGTTSSGGYGTGGGAMFSGSNGGAAGGSGNSGSTAAGANGGAAGGGGGGGTTSANAATTGGSGGIAYSQTVSGAGNGGSTGSAGTAPGAAAINSGLPSNGSGGGGGATSGSGGAGASGVAYGGGGGGGGGSQGSSSGAGGAGGPGIVIIICQ